MSYQQKMRKSARNTCPTSENFSGREVKAEGGQHLNHVLSRKQPGLSLEDGPHQPECLLSILRIGAL